MSRIPPKPRNELPPDQQETHDTMTRIANAAFGPSGSKFVYEEANGAYNGPFPFFIAAPRIGMVISELLAEFAKLPIPADVRETAIMTVGGQFQAGYETYSHVPQAIDAGLTREQAETLREGTKKPDGLSEGCSAAYDVAHHLSTKKGPMPQELWDRSVEAIGKEGTVGLLHYIGFYAYVCVALNGMDAPVPE